MALKERNPAVIPLRRAVGWIAASVVGVVVSALFCWYAYSYLLSKRAVDPTYQLFAIVQTGPEKEALKSGYLGELLGLSVDRPVNLYAFDCAAARRRLLASPLIKSATVKTYLPGTVYVEYCARKPVAYIRDYSNTAVDAEGVLIPSDPFFTPKRIPTIYLGLPEQQRIWGLSVQGSKLLLAFALRDLVADTLSGDATTIKLIDVSLADATSFGEREIVITLEERLEYLLDGRRVEYVQPVILRLDSSHYPQALANYVVLRAHLAKSLAKAVVERQPLVAQTLPMRIVDLRLPHLAYLTQGL